MRCHQQRTSQLELLAEAPSIPAVLISSSPQELKQHCFFPVLLQTHPFFLFFYLPKTECCCRRIESRITKTFFFFFFFFFFFSAAAAAEDLWVSCSCICCCSAAAAAAEGLCLDTLNLQIHNCETAACLLPLKIFASVTTLRQELLLYSG